MNTYRINTGPNAKEQAYIANQLRDRGVRVTYVGYSQIFVRTDLEPMQLASITGLGAECLWYPSTEVERLAKEN